MPAITYKRSQIRKLEIVKKPSEWVKWMNGEVKTPAVVASE
jgi:hypothetical protein